MDVLIFSIHIRILYPVYPGIYLYVYTARGVDLHSNKIRILECVYMHVHRTIGVQLYIEAKYLGLEPSVYSGT